MSKYARDVLIDLMQHNLVWDEVNNQSRYYTTIYQAEKYYMRLNNFPDEPLYTVIINDEHFDFDDLPGSWKVNY